MVNGKGLGNMKVVEIYCKYFVSRYILGEADRRNMLKDLPENKALEVCKM